MSTGEPYEKGTTIRYPSTALLCVNSENSEKFDPDGFRVDGTTPSDLYINKQQPLLFGYLTRIALTEMNVQWGFPNVYSDITGASNNSLTLRLYNAAPTPVVQGVVRIFVPEAFYTAGRLGAVLAEALNASPAITSVLGANSFSVQVGTLNCQEAENVADAGQTKKALSSHFSIGTISDQGFFEIMPFSFKAPGLPTLSDDLTNMMGLTPGVLSGARFYKFFTGGYASMLRTPFIDIVSNSLTANQTVRDNDTTKPGRDSILTRLYLANEEIVPREITITYDLDAPYAANAYTDNAIGTTEFAFRREFKFPKQIQWTTTENVDFVDLRVIDYRGNLLRYSPTIILDGIAVEQFNTADFQFTLMATEM